MMHDSVRERHTAMHKELAKTKMAIAGGGCDPPGHSSSYAAYVYCGGGISLHGKGITGWASGTFGTVRPALWINLEPSKRSEQNSFYRRAAMGYTCA